MEEEEEEAREHGHTQQETGASASGHEMTDTADLVLLDRVKNQGMGFLGAKGGWDGEERESQQRERDKTQSLQSAKQGLPLFGA